MTAVVFVKMAYRLSRNPAGLLDYLAGDDPADDPTEDDPAGEPSGHNGAQNAAELPEWESAFFDKIGNKLRIGKTDVLRLRRSWEMARDMTAAV